MKSFNNLIILFVILIALIFLYRRFEDKLIREEHGNTNYAIQQYLLNTETLGKSTKPILWIHVPYEYNSRKWSSFGSRSSIDLNQSYLYLTVRSIISKCDKSFTICIIDDNSFDKLIPNWTINMNKLSDPILNNARTLGLMKLLYIYGGLICPISFLCMRDLLPMYENGILYNKLMVCESPNNNNSIETTFIPNVNFCGAYKENQIVMNLCKYISELMSIDNTADSVFTRELNNWLNTQVHTNNITLINGMEIGIKKTDEIPILIEDLMSNNYLDIHTSSFGILIPALQILNRTKYEWFARLSEKQVLESNTIIGSYILLYSTKQDDLIIEPLKIKPSWIGFWKTPLYSQVYGLKPNFLGDNLIKKNI
jgi:hypothetical protein